jgi:hypothetical protein
MRPELFDFSRNAHSESTTMSVDYAVQKSDAWVRSPPKVRTPGAVQYDRFKSKLVKLIELDPKPGREPSAKDRCLRGLATRLGCADRNGSKRTRRGRVRSAKKRAKSGGNTIVLATGQALEAILRAKAWRLGAVGHSTSQDWSAASARRMGSRLRQRRC